MAIFAPIIGFLSGLVTKIFGYLIFNFVQGGLRRVAFGIVTFGAIYAATYTFIRTTNDLLTGLVNNASGISQSLIVGVAAFLPPNLPYYVSIVLSYYATSLTFHFLIEVTKFKQRLAESATSTTGSKP